MATHMHRMVPSYDREIRDIWRRFSAAVPTPTLTLCNAVDPLPTTISCCNTAVVTGGNLIVGSGAVPKNVSAANMGMFRNRVINGNMSLDQVYQGAPLTTSIGTSAYYVPDQMIIVSASNPAGGAVLTLGTVLAFTGSNVNTGQSALQVVVATPVSSVGSNQYLAIQHRIEGTNMADLGWGMGTNYVGSPGGAQPVAAPSSPVVMSFYMANTVPGVYSMSVTNLVTNHIYASTFTVTSYQAQAAAVLNSGMYVNIQTVYDATLPQNQAWQRHALYVPPDTFTAPISSPFNSVTSANMLLSVGLANGGGGSGGVTGLGFNFVQSNQWNSPSGPVGLNSHLCAAGLSNAFLTTSGAFMQITGLQLERGDLVTPFEFRPQVIEQRLCQRYVTTLSEVHCSAYTSNGVPFGLTLPLPTPMRATPTWTNPGGAVWVSSNCGPVTTSTLSTSPTSAWVQVNGLAAGAASFTLAGPTNQVVLRADL